MTDAQFLRGVASDLDVIADSDDPAQYIETLAETAQDLRALALRMEAGILP